MDYLFKGTATALYTPFTKNGIDYSQLERLIERQIKGGVNALILLGTTGESPTVLHGERAEIIAFTKKQIRGRIPLIVGTGSNCTATCCTLTKEAKELGADGALIVTPYYNKCEQDGLYEHYKTVCKFARLPIICYNVPSRTCVDIEPSTAEKLCALDCVWGFKEASCDTAHAIKTLEICNAKKPVYCGNDNLNLFFMERGAFGTISVLSNVIPSIIVEFISNFEKFYDRRNKEFLLFYNELCQTVFEKVNPLGIKLTAEILYGEECNFRLPLIRPEDNFYQKLSMLCRKLKSFEEYTLC